MRCSAYVLKSLGQTLDDSHIAIAIVISLPTSYSTLRTILMAADKLSVDPVVAQILVEEKSCKTTQSALVTKGTTSPKSKDGHHDGTVSRKYGASTTCRRTGVH